ncbi:MAG: hypothetical protein FWC78_00185 [Defluviitaleaceae bacterium]|nr:hypothetical protein [Defluviitaleaceae bacterium]
MPAFRVIGACMLLAMFAVFAACGRNGGEVVDTPTLPGGTAETIEPTETAGIGNDDVVYIPQPYVPVDDTPGPVAFDLPEGDYSEFLDVTVSGREVTVALEGVEADSVTILVFGAGNQLVYIEQVDFQTPFSYVFTLGDGLAAGEYSLIIGGDGEAFPMRVNFDI